MARFKPFGALAGSFFTFFLLGSARASGETAPPFVSYARGQDINFSQDQGAHLDEMTEWWYFNGHLTAVNGNVYGYELCFFRETDLGYFVHTAITDETGQKFYFLRKFYSPFEVALSSDKADLSYGSSTGTKQTGDFSYNIWGSLDIGGINLELISEKTPLLINGNGVIGMPGGESSYYYSLTKIQTRGALTLNGQQFEVTGQSWMDHQWGNFVTHTDGWDWFSLQMEDNTEYNLFSLRDSSGGVEDQYVNFLDSDDQPWISRQFDLKRTEWWKSPATGNYYVTKWELAIPGREESFTVDATVREQEVYPTNPLDVAPTYWEGSCKVVKILKDGTRINGVGYSEHFPYKSPVQN